MNEGRVDMPNISNLIPYSVQVDDCRLITDPLERQVCPLCRAEVRPFFINFNDKMFMCENIECDYPFGIEELKFYKENDNVTVDTELESSSIITRTTTNCSIISEICSTKARLSPVIDDDNQHFEPRALDVSEYLSTVTLPKIQDKTETHISDLDLLNSKPRAGPSKLIIQNENYVKNLIHLQKLGKRKKPLVNETELELYNSNATKNAAKNTNNTNQFKINIQNGDSNEPVKVNLDFAK